MVGALVVEAARQEARVATIGVHPPEGGRPARFGAAEDDVPALRRFAGAKVPDGRVTVREADDGVVRRVEPADFRAAAGEGRLEIAVEMVRVGTLRLEFPRDLRAGNLAREKNLSVPHPPGH